MPNPILSSLKPDAYSLHYSTGKTGPEPIETYNADSSLYEYSYYGDSVYRRAGRTTGGNGALRWNLGKHGAFETSAGLDQTSLHAFREFYQDGEGDCSYPSTVYLDDDKVCLDDRTHMSEQRVGLAVSAFMTSNQDIRKTAFELGGTVRPYILFTPVKACPYIDAQVSGSLGLRAPLTSGRRHSTAVSIRGEAGINGVGSLASGMMYEAAFTLLDLDDEDDLSSTTSLDPPTFAMLHLGVLWE